MTDFQAIAARQQQITARLNDLATDPYVDEETHGPERNALIREYRQLQRSAEIGQVADTAAAREGYREAGDDPGGIGRDWISARSEVIWRHEAPWEDLRRDAFITGEGMVSRAHDVLDAVSDEWMPAAAKERLAEQFDDPRERDAASRLAVALASPHYLRAYRAMMMDPAHGDRLWSPAEREAWSHAGLAARAASLGTASLGFMLPLELDPAIILTNVGAANPWRELATIKTTVSNTWNGVVSAGGTAVWLGEGTEASDNTPTVDQLQITPRKGASWIYGSFESIGSTGFGGDTAFAENVPRILADAKDRLEADSFANGDGNAPNPTGFWTAFGTANDATVAGTATRAATDLYGLLEGVAPRYRTPGSRVAWLASLPWLDRYRGVPAFSGATGAAIVDDSGPRPRTAGYPWYEMSAFATGTAATSRVVAVGDWSQVYIADRWPGYTLFEPLVKGTANQFPTGQSGWFYVFRSNLAITTVNAFKALRLT